MSASEDEDEYITMGAENVANKRIAMEASKPIIDSSDDERPRPLEDNDEAGGNDFDNMMHRKKAENRRFR